MNRASSLQRRRAIADALQITWMGCQGQYTDQLYIAALDAERRLSSPSSFSPTRLDIHFGGKTHSVSLTQVEDLLEVIRVSVLEQRSANG